MDEDSIYNNLPYFKYVSLYFFFILKMSCLYIKNLLVLNIVFEKRRKYENVDNRKYYIFFLKNKDIDNGK